MRLIGENEKGLEVMTESTQDLSLTKVQDEVLTPAMTKMNLTVGEKLTHKSYHELADVPVVEQDVLAQLHSNMAMLEDLQNRFSFVMREVRYLMKIEG